MKEIKIQVSDEMYDEMLRISNELDTQDNAATASPYYYTIRQERQIPTASDYSDKYIWVDDYGDGDIWWDLYNEDEFEKYLSESLWYEKEEIEKELKNYRFYEAWNSYFDDEEYPYVDLEDYISNEFNITKHFYINQEFFTNVFLTESAAKQYLKNDLHNLIWEKDQIYQYVEYARKNPELNNIIEFLKLIKKSNK